MMPYIQANRRIAISTPLGKDALLLRGFRGTEAISQPFQFDLDLLSENDSLKFDDVVGKNVTLRIFDTDGSERNWNGFISRFSQGSQDRRLTAYRAHMVPWLWFLTRTSDCKIFQNKKVPDIIQKVFKDLGFHDFELRLHGQFAPRDYCVQYRETDFNFVSRLMEEEGIYYYFRHDSGKHTLILANDPAAHEPCPKQNEARYDARGGAITYEEVITDWRYEQEFRPGTWTQTDYNFETPSTSLAVTVKGKNPYELYDYPGEHRVRSEGDRLARIRLQEQTASCAVSHGNSGCRHFSTGCKFTFKDHYRSDLNQPYLLTSVHHSATQAGDYGGSPEDEDLTYQNQFQCIPFSVPFRPPRVTPQPFVQGCQTAVVVGPGGEEIYTDKHGRVKVQFHWDRDGKRNENSSCWVRVSHPWAGKGWGAVSIPRIGQEVIVDFLEGNPDEPIIIGRVYNGEQGVPFGMPGGAVVSGMKSSTVKGGGYNEISLNDTAGSELIQIHGQHDMDSKIEHDQRLHVVNNRTKNVDVDETTTIGSNRTEKVGANEKITIGSDRTEHVGGNETITISKDRTETVTGSETHSIKGTRTHTVSKSEAVTVKLTRTHNVLINDMLNVGAAQEVNVIGAQALTVGALRTKTVVGSEVVTIRGSETITIKGAVTETIGKDHNEKVVGSRGAHVGKDEAVEAGKKIMLSAGDEITLSSGSASISLKKDGTIKIVGKDIILQASGKISGIADGKVILRGQQIQGN